VAGGAQFGQIFVAALGRMAGQDATDALLRQAIYSPHDDVRQAAAEKLADRSLFSYAPTLMGMLQTPIHAQFDEVYTLGEFRHRFVASQEGPLSSNVLDSFGGTTMGVFEVQHPISGKRPDVYVGRKPDPTRNGDFAAIDQVRKLNALTKERNPLIIKALETATGQSAGESATEWWKWWLDYNEIYQPPEKIVSITSRYEVPEVYTIRYRSCFVAGTKVWTMTGPLTIETIRPGECVLAQNPETGELAYKPVLANTVRPESPTLAIQCQSDTITVTRGHPFWVSGKGWRMAKELTAGDRLHSVHGPVEITSTSESTDAVCYNLVVADLGNYFVGEHKVLVHDNNIRDVTPAVVPGLITLTK
jgi:hypothetical protein